MDQPVCSFNLGKIQKRRRLFMGIFLFTVAAALSIFFTHQEIPLGLRAVVFVPYFAAMLGFLQAKERTCVVFAYQNLRDLGEGAERIQDEASSRFLKIKAQKIITQAAFIAFLLTVITFLIR